MAWDPNDITPTMIAAGWATMDEGRKHQLRLSLGPGTGLAEIYTAMRAAETPSAEVLRERERCATICESLTDESGHPDAAALLLQAAMAIRGEET